MCCFWEKKKEAMKFQFETTLIDALHNAHPDNTRASEASCETLEGKIGQVYARGIINGAVAAIMALTGCRFQTALDAVKARAPFNIDPETVPHAWRENW